MGAHLKLERSNGLSGSRPWTQLKKKTLALGSGVDSEADLYNLRKAVASPMQFVLPGAMMDGLPTLRKMTITIMCTLEPGFITSDSPVSWFDPTVPREKFLNP